MGLQQHQFGESFLIQLADYRVSSGPREIPLKIGHTEIPDLVRTGLARPPLNPLPASRLGMLSHSKANYVLVTSLSQ